MVVVVGVIEMVGVLVGEEVLVGVIEVVGDIVGVCVGVSVVVARLNPGYLSKIAEISYPTVT